MESMLRLPAPWDNSLAFALDRFVESAVIVRAKGSPRLIQIKIDRCRGAMPTHGGFYCCSAIALGGLRRPSDEIRCDLRQALGRGQLCDAVKRLVRTSTPT